MSDESATATIDGPSAIEVGQERIEVALAALADRLLAVQVELAKQNALLGELGAKVAEYEPLIKAARDRLDRGAGVRAMLGKGKS